MCNTTSIINASCCQPVILISLSPFHSLFLPLPLSPSPSFSFSLSLSLIKRSCSKWVWLQGNFVTRLNYEPSEKFLFEAESRNLIETPNRIRCILSPQNESTQWCPPPFYAFLPLPSCLPSLQCPLLSLVFSTNPYQVIHTLQRRFCSTLSACG